jgi:hypothetical protein
VAVLTLAAPNSGIAVIGLARSLNERACRHSIQGCEKENAMLLIRDIMYCKPGKVRPMIEKYKEMAKLSEKMGIGKMRVLTDLSAERFWTIVSEFEVPSFEAFMSMGQDTEEMKKFEEIMKGYHDFVDHGRREIYTVEV